MVVLPVFFGPARKRETIAIDDDAGFFRLYILWPGMYIEPGKHAQSTASHACKGRLLTGLMRGGGGYVRGGGWWLV
jgi:hypothetical protein